MKGGEKGLASSSSHVRTVLGSCQQPLGSPRLLKSQGSVAPVERWGGAKGGRGELWPLVEKVFLLESEAWSVLCALP